MPSFGDVVAGGLISLAFLGLIAAAEIWRHVASPNPEWTRKLVHFGGGAICILLPFFIESHWVVLAMAIGMGALFLASKYAGLLQSVHGIERKSRGTEYYPIVIYVLFLLSHTQPWKYLICVLVLAVSDSLAAVIGSKYGRIRYEVEDEQKSLEGSLAFFAVTYLIVLLPLIFWSDDPDIPSPAHCALAALLVAVLVTGFEAVALGGRDNIWIPLGTYVVLTKILRQQLAEIALQNVSLLVICCVIGISAWRSRAFNVGGTLVFILAVYTSWSLGSFHWALPVLSAYLMYVFVLYVARRPQTVKVRTVVQILLPPFVVLIMANIAWLQRSKPVYDYLYGPYLAGCLAVAVQSAWIQNRRDWLVTLGWRPIGVLAVNLVCWAVVVIPPWLLLRGVPVAALFCVGAATAVTGLIHDWLMGERIPEIADRPWIAKRFAMTSAAIFIMAILQIVGVIPLWPVWMMNH